MIVPWLASVVGHAVLVLLMLAIAWATYTLTQDKKTIVPDLRLGGPPVTPLTLTRLETSTLTVSTPTPTQEAAQRDTPQLTAPTAALSPAVGMDRWLDERPRFESAQVDAQFATRFFGVGGNARRIVFVVDASASLIGTLQFVTGELAKAIEQLSTEQSFSVIFFQDGQVKRMPGGLVPATGRNKAAAIAWFDPARGVIKASGTTNPVDGLSQAFALKPDLIYLLSDDIRGKGTQEVVAAELLAQIDKLNRRNTQICTIQFVYDDPKQTMRQIAEANTGTSGLASYRFVGPKELGLE